MLGVTRRGFMAEAVLWLLVFILSWGFVSSLVSLQRWSVLGLPLFWSGSVAHALVVTIAYRAQSASSRYWARVVPEGVAASSNNRMQLPKREARLGGRLLGSAFLH